MIQVVDYDPAWPAMASSAIAELTTALPGVFTEIEHIGSTAVPGLAAKPVIDLMAPVPDLSAVPGEPLVRLGYRKGEGFGNRLFYQRDTGGVRSHHLHVVTLDTWPTRSQRILRDHLRTHPEDVERYAQLKRSLAETVTDGAAYTNGKTKLIQEITDRARAERGLPPVTVWET